MEPRPGYWFLKLKHNASGIRNYFGILQDLWVIHIGINLYNDYIY